MPRDSAQFVFMTCRTGAETAVKEEVARLEPDWRMSYSRPGFLTFKNTGDRPIEDRQLAERNWTFAHAHGISLGRLTDSSLKHLVAKVWQSDDVADLMSQNELADVHVWQREGSVSIDLDEQTLDASCIRNLSAPSVSRQGKGTLKQVLTTPLCREIEKALREAAPESLKKLRGMRDGRRRATPRNAMVLDVVVLEPGEWWIGYHRAVRQHERWPGGAIPVRLPAHAVSRAYAKMEEAIQWSGLPFAAGEECVEIGCAPGGASQSLLERGLFVTGIDPAEIDPTVVAHPRFRHLKKRGKDVRRKEFEGVRWLAADMNIAPEATLDEVEPIVTHPGIAIRGMVLTLKFSDWRAAARLPEFVMRVRAWGYREVRTRQLITGGQEVCLVALRRKALRRLGRRLNRGRRGRPQAGSWADAAHPTLPEPHF